MLLLMTMLMLMTRIGPAGFSGKMLGHKHEPRPATAGKAVCRNGCELARTGRALADTSLGRGEGQCSYDEVTFVSVPRSEKSQHEDSPVPGHRGGSHAHI